jgi:hypothetical protein
MKHILNNLTEEEKNSIRQQHIGGMNVVNENFNKLIDSKLGDVQPLINEQLKSDTIKRNNFIDPTKSTNARGKGAGVYKSEVGRTVTKNITFGKDKMETGSDVVKKDTKEYQSLVATMNKTNKPNDGKKYKVTIIGGASAVGSSSGYDNKALAKRRADKLVQSLQQDVPGLKEKFDITTNGVVGTATKLNSIEAYKEQFVNVKLEVPQTIEDKSSWESDSTITTKGGGLPFDNGTTICVTIPSGFKKSFINMLYEFKTENNINLTYKENR